MGGQQGSPRRTCRPCVCVNCLHVRVCRQNLCMSAFFCRLCLYMFCSSRVWSFRALPVLDRHAPLGQLTQQLFSCRGPASVWALIWEKMRDSPVVSLGENYIERFFKIYLSLIKGSEGTVSYIPLVRQIMDTTVKRGHVQVQCRFV